MSDLALADNIEAPGAGINPDVKFVNPQPKNKTVKRLRDLKKSSRDQLMISPNDILVEDGHNPRDYNLPENRAHLDHLKASILENGTLSPLHVRYDPVRRAAVLVDGECGLRANLELIAEGVAIEAVPCIQVSGRNEADRLLMAVIANQNKPLSDLELGGAFCKLYAYGWPEVKIAAKVGKTVGFVKRAIELADAPDAVRSMVAKQEITPNLAISELRKNGSEAVEALKEMVTTAKAEGKNHRNQEADAHLKFSEPYPGNSQDVQGRVGGRHGERGQRVHQRRTCPFSRGIPPAHSVA